MTRFAVLGAGRIGVVHAESISKLPDAELAVVYDLDEARARAIAEPAGADIASTAEETWQREDVDAVVIASPSDTHAAALRGAAAAGKAIYCEKPIDKDIEAGRSAVEFVERTGVPAMTGFARRFASRYVSLAQEIEKGTVGSVRTVRIVSREPGMPPRDYIAASGGIFRDKFIHYFDMVSWLAGAPVVEVHSMGSALEDPGLVEFNDVDTSVTTLRMENGVVCTIEAARGCAYGFDEIVEIYGSKGLMTVQREMADPIRLYTHGNLSQPGTPANYPDSFGRNFEFAMAGFVEGLKRSGPLKPSLRDGLQAQMVAEAATESLLANCPVKIRAV